jgi:hypothetical protein
MSGGSRGERSRVVATRAGRTERQVLPLSHGSSGARSFREPVCAHPRDALSLEQDDQQENEQEKDEREQQPGQAAEARTGLGSGRDDRHRVATGLRDEHARRSRRRWIPRNWHAVGAVAVVGDRACNVRARLGIRHSDVGLVSSSQLGASSLRPDKPCFLARLGGAARAEARPSPGAFSACAA